MNLLFKFRLIASVFFILFPYCKAVNILRIHVEYIDTNNFNFSYWGILLFKGTQFILIMFYFFQLMKIMSKKYYYEYTKSKDYMKWFITFISFSLFIDCVSATLFGHSGKKEWLGNKMCDCLYNEENQIARRVSKMILEKSKLAMIFVIITIVKLKRTDDIL